MLVNLLPTRMRLVAIGLALATASACADDNIIGPGNQLEVANDVDNFEWQVSALDNVSQTLTYDWEITGSTATVDQSSSVSQGSAVVRIFDADGNEVYSRDLDEDGTFDTGTGTLGTWRIDVVLSDVDGTLNFRVQKKP